MSIDIHCKRSCGARQGALMLLDIETLPLMIGAKDKGRNRMPAQQSITVVEQLQDAVRGSGLSLHELGRRTGVSEGQLSRFLRGQRTLTLPAAARVCSYLGLALSRRRTRAAG